MNKQLWKFFLLHFKQSGHTKYVFEAFRLLTRVNVTSTPKEQYELIWNRYCSTKNGKGHNRPLDLQMEFMNRVFKDDIKSFHTHLTPQSVHRTANAVNSIDYILNCVDQQIKTGHELAATSKPDITNDVIIIVGTLVEAGALTARSC